jgi:hypothetical protein
MHEQPTTHKPDYPRWSVGLGSLAGILCGIAGAVIGGCWGVRLDDEQHAYMVDDWLPQWTFFWSFADGFSGWLIGWLLTALLPRKRRRTLRDYLTILVCGLLPPCAIIAWIIEEF